MTVLSVGMYLQGSVTQQDPKEHFSQGSEHGRMPWGRYLLNHTSIITGAPGP